MTQKHKVKVSLDLITHKPKSKYHKPHPEGYGFQSGDYVFSDDIEDWLYGKTRRGKRYPDLF